MQVDNDENIKYIVLSILIHNSIIKDKSKKKLSREIDVINYKKEYTKRKHKER